MFQRPLATAGLAAMAVIAIPACDLGNGIDERASHSARAYLRAAAEGDVERLCALRTDGALRRWGGQVACEREAVGIAIDPVRADVSRGLRERLQKKAAAVDPGTLQLVEVYLETSTEDARAVIDFGKAMIDDGHAVGGEILQMRLKMQGGDYRIARLEFATFVD